MMVALVSFAGLDMTFSSLGSVTPMITPSRDRAWPETVDCTMPDADKPGLGAGTAGQKAVRSREHVVGHLEGPAVYVDRHDLTPVAGLDVRTDRALVDVITTPCVLLWVIARLPFRH